MKIITGAVIMYVYLQHPDQIQGSYEVVKDNLVSALDWISIRLKS
jgi:hypothetical protein